MEINTVPTIVCFEKLFQLVILSIGKQFSNGKEWVEQLLLFGKVLYLRRGI